MNKTTKPQKRGVKPKKRDREGKNYTAEEIEYIEEKWGNVSIQSMAKHLQRTPEAVRQKALKIGLGGFLENGDRYLTKHQLFQALGLGGGGYRYFSWIQNRELPTHKIKRLNQTFEVVYIDEFWKWAEKNQSFLDFSSFEKWSLGPEPKWVEKKRSRDFERHRNFKNSPWTKQEDEKLKKLLKEFKYSYMELSQILKRTTGAIQRRICELGLNERPIKADNHIKWTSEQYQLLGEMIKSGSNYEEMSEVIGKSSKAIRGRVFDMYLTEKLDKVRKYIGAGSWGDGRPAIPLKYKKLMTTAEKQIAIADLSLVAGYIGAVAEVKKTVAEDFGDYWQKDTCHHWNSLKGCSEGENSCDTCPHYRRKSNKGDEE